MNERLGDAAELDGEARLLRRCLHADPTRLTTMGQAAIQRIEEVALWSKKIDFLCTLYEECRADQVARSHDPRSQ